MGGEGDGGGENGWGRERWQIMGGGKGLGVGWGKVVPPTVKYFPCPCFDLSKFTIFALLICVKLNR
jgi:hypothetical protein